MGAGDDGLPPLFSQVEPLFGVGAFARGGTRFQHFVQGGSPTALAFESAWYELAGGASGTGVAGPLTLSYADAVLLLPLGHAIP